MDGRFVNFIKIKIHFRSADNIIYSNVNNTDTTTIFDTIFRNQHYNCDNFIRVHLLPVQITFGIVNAELY